MIILNGKLISQNILNGLRSEVIKLPFQPLFCDVLVGNDAVALSYVKIKGRAAEKLGLAFRLEQLPENISQEDLVKKIFELNKMQNMCGLIIQLPLPAHVDRQEVLDAIEHKLDVDCLGKNGHDPLIPPTAAAVMALVDELPDTLKSGHFVIVGQGQLVGKPVGILLKQRNYKLTVADASTQNLKELTKTADVLISGTGKANLITANFVKPGAAVIDAGTAEMDGGIVGDVDFESVKNVAGYITPVPGGVGPLTVAMLLKNVVEVSQSF